MGRRMLRAHVDDEFVSIEKRLLGSFEVEGRERVRVHHRSYLLATFNSQVDLHPLVVLLQDAIVLAQGMSLPAVRKQNALEVRMSVELDAEHVEDFALQPVGRSPERNGTWQALVLGYERLHADALVARKRIEHPDHVELFLALGIMHGGDVDAVIELLPVAEDLENLGYQRAVDHHVILAEIGERLDSRAVLAFQFGHHRRIPWGGHRTGRLWWRSGSRRLRSWSDGSCRFRWSCDG